jgi:hypothetical protein
MRAMLVVLFLVAAPARAHAQWLAAGYVDNNVAGDVQSGRLGLGVSAGYYLRGRIGLELDGEVHGHFFRDEDVAALVPAGVDLNTRAVLGSANLVLPYCVHGAGGTWCPYATAGIGIIHAMFEGIAHAPGTSNVERTQTNLAWNAGLGLTHWLTRWVGFRVDARYLRALVDESSTSGGYFKDYGYCRLSVGVTFGGEFVNARQ